MTQLLKQGALNKEAAAAVLEYYRNVDAFNRSPQTIAELDAAGDQVGAGDEAERAIQKATLLVSAAHIARLQDDPSPELEPFKRHFTKRVRVYGDRMPYDDAMRALALIPGAPYAGIC